MRTWTLLGIVVASLAAGPAWAGEDDRAEARRDTRVLRAASRSLRKADAHLHRLQDRPAIRVGRKPLGRLIGRVMPAPLLGRERRIERWGGNLDRLRAKEGE